MTSVGGSTLLIAAFLAFFQGTSGGIFERYCRKPPFLAKRGNLEGNLCTVQFKAQSKTKPKAFDICEGASPFTVEDAIPGKTTICKYGRPPFGCEGNEEVSIESSCVVIRGYGTFDKYQDECGSHYQPHAAGTKQNLLWISVFLSNVAAEVWSADEGEQAKGELNPLTLKKRKQTKDANATEAIKLRLRTIPDGIRWASAIYADSSEKYPFLCSRRAILQANAIDVLVSDAKQLHLNVKTFKDRNGDDRPFVVFDTVHSVEATKFQANYDKFKDLCSTFVNGYVASRYDFYNLYEYKRAIEQLGKFQLYRTTVARGKDKTEPFSCSDSDLSKKQDTYSKTFRIKFNYILPNSSTAAVKKEHWAPLYPMNTCADTPRITAVMAIEGYRDMPAIARLPVICTFGNPPDVKLRHKNDICSSAAHFNERKGRCECNDPKEDATVQQPELYKDFPPGTLCVTCNSKTEKRSVLFIMDQSSTVGREGMSKEKKFILDILSVLTNVRAGGVVISCPSYVGLEMKHYTTSEVENWVRGQSSSVDAGGSLYTGTYEAYKLGKEMLDKEGTVTKTIIVTSDGENSNCRGDTERDYYYRSPRPWEYDIAKQWRDSGATIIYVLVGGWGYPDNAREIVGYNEKLIRRVKDHNSLNKDLINDVVSLMCTPQFT